MRSGHPARAGRVLLAVAALAAAARAEDAYWSVPLSALALEDGPSDLEDAAAPFGLDALATAPRVVLDGPGEAYVRAAAADPFTGAPGEPPRLFARVPLADGGGEAPAGVLWLWDAERGALSPHRFTLAPELAGPAAREGFLAAELLHFDALARAPIAGAPWFAVRAGEVRAELLAAGGDPVLVLEGRAPTVAGDGDLDSTFDLASGGRALGENLRLDHLLRPSSTAPEDGEWVPIDEIAGVETPAMDWSALEPDPAPELDPLAAFVPADQHALLCPSMDAFLRLVDAFERDALPLVDAFRPLLGDARTRLRVEERLALPLATLVPGAGEESPTAVAVTGSDPYLRSGSDVAVLFQVARPEPLERALREQQAALARRFGAKTTTGEVGGLAYTAAVSDDRSLSSYLARWDDVVLVTTSLAQLERIAAVRGGAAALATAPEYRFFRSRYPRGAAETAFLVLSDATIRRWCGPRWRIGASRRVRAAAALAERAAERVASLVAPGPGIEADLGTLEVPDGGSVRWTGSGAISQAYGRLGALTPIVELPLERATPAERAAYEAFRQRYERGWSQVFDPIAARVFVGEGIVDVDLSVLPLQAASEYREWIELTSGAVPLDPAAGDPHPEAIASLVLALDRGAPPFRRADEALRLVEMSGIRPLDWVGDDLSLFVDADPVWAAIAADPRPDALFEHDVWDLPIAVTVDVRRPLALAGFLTALRAFADGSAPDLLHWDTREHAGASYVAVGSDAVGPDEVEVYYAALPDAFLVTPNEALVQRALARREPPDGAPDPEPYLGKHVALRVTAAGLEVVRDLLDGAVVERQRDACWANLPILNAWHARFPGADPLELVERTFGERPRCPAGGEYVRNEVSRAFACSVHGHPGAPLAADVPALLPGVETLDVGLTFEHGGLRARTRLRRR